MIPGTLPARSGKGELDRRMTEWWRTFTYYFPTPPPFVTKICRKISQKTSSLRVQYDREARMCMEKLLFLHVPSVK